MEKPYPLARTVLCCVIWCITAIANAQHGGYDYLIQFTGGINGAQHKAILSAINDQDPNALVSIAPLEQQAKVHSTVRLSSAQMAQELAPYGLTVDFLTGALPTTAGDRKASTPFPKYIDTGNANSDSLSYAAAKAAWLAANPSHATGRDALRPLSVPVQP